MHAQVIFVGEAGEDTGGLKREFWRIEMLLMAYYYRFYALKLKKRF